MSRRTGRPSDETYDNADLHDLHAQTVRVSVGAVIAFAVGLLAVSAIGFDRIEVGLFVVAVALIAVAGGGHAIYRFGTTLAAVSLVAGLTASFVLAVSVLPSDIVAPWFSVVVLVTCALFGWRWGTAHLTVAFGLLLVAAGQGLFASSAGFVINTVLLGLAALFISWLISRPTQTALQWASSSYLQELTLVQEARERQAELARLSKTLGESYYRLEQLNLELDAARRAAHQARQLKEQFAAAVSHELRTPLNLIIGFCEMMVLSPARAYGKPPPANYRDDLEAIYRSAVHISTLVDDILDLSQIDADRMALHRGWVPLTEVVQQAVEPVGALFRNRRLRLDVQAEANLPLVCVDTTRIRQILINLLANAARFTETGGVTIRVGQAAGSVFVSVADTGPGIAPDELPYVFDEFRQVGGASARHGGSGLGLAVSKRFAELHEGSLSVESTLGEGTSFTLRLPLDTTATTRPETRQAWDDRLGQRVRGTAEAAVLVVDESRELERILTRYLDGYQVLTSADLHRDDAGAIAEVFQAIIVGSAADRARWDELAATTPRLARLPVFSCDLQTGRRAIARYGVSDYLLKPVTRDHLRAALQRQGGIAKTRARVLVVDDDPGLLRLVEKMITSIGPHYEVLTADDGNTALDLMRQHRPDCVLLDLLLPTVDGYRVIEAMRTDPALAEIPVLVVTAKGMHSENVTVNAINLTREEGLTVAEAMRWFKVGLDSFLGSRTSAPEPEAAPAA